MRTKVESSANVLSGAKSGREGLRGALPMAGAEADENMAALRRAVVRWDYAAALMRFTWPPPSG